jgi:hypothetical protein
MLCIVKVPNYGLQVVNVVNTTKADKLALCNVLGTGSLILIPTNKLSPCYGINLPVFTE